MNILKPGNAHISRKLMITVVYIIVDAATVLHCSGRLDESPFNSSSLAHRCFTRTIMNSSYCRRDIVHFAGILQGRGSKKQQIKPAKI